MQTIAFEHFSGQNTQRHTDTDRHRQTQTDTNRDRQTQTDTDRHRPDTDRH